MTFRWPFSKTKHKHWVGINLSSLTPSAVIYSHEGVIDAMSFDQEQGIEGLELWLKGNVAHGIPTVLVLDDDDYELLLVEAPNVPDEELSAAIEFRISDLLAQPVEETAIQALRLPEDAYRGRMSMAHVIASPNEKVRAWVEWAEKLHLKVVNITVPEMSWLNVLAVNSISQGIAVLELGPKQSCIRLYQDGALYLTRQVEVGIDALDIQTDDEAESEAVNTATTEVEVELEVLEDLDNAVVAVNEINLEEMSDEDFSSENFNEEEIGLDLVESDTVAEEDDLNIDESAYVGFAPKAKVNEQQVQSLVLDVQRSLDYYESQLGMGQITQLWLMAGDKDLSNLVEELQPALTATVEQPNIKEKLSQGAGIHVSDKGADINDSVTALGGALAYVAS